ncbi:hypothetical protein KY285_005565 [Solanum tuberosum]|nr:hypothetical protein KY284_005720 [Solanum tuberosum]KAH0752417.1 hypothetical protein KY285_005565 [Solanum tuberosum]
MKKVAAYFAQALHHKIHRLIPQDIVESSYTTNQLLHKSFYESCLLLRFAHFTAANQSILEAFTDSKRVHVIDFSLNQGSQWPELLQALALRPGGPLAFRLSRIGGHSQPDESTDALQEVGWKLAQFAGSIGVEFEFHGFVVHILADLEAPMLNIRPRAFEEVSDLIKPKIVTIPNKKRITVGVAI